MYIICHECARPKHTGKRRPRTDHRIFRTRNLNTLSTGSISFNGNVGGNTRLANVTLTNPGTVASTGAFNANNITISGAAGNVGFSGTGANATNAININSQGITGSYLGVTGLLNANAGTIIATTSFDNLDISGAGATLSAGYIGAPGTINQSMANLITIDTILSPEPNDLYKFADFTIGFIPPINTGVSTETQTAILSTTRQASFVQNDFFAAAPASTDSQNDALFINQQNFSSSWPKIIEGILYVDPILKNKISSSYF